MGNENSTRHHRNRLARHGIYPLEEATYQVRPVNQENLRWMELRVRELEVYLHQDLDEMSAELRSGIATSTSDDGDWNQSGLELWEASRRGRADKVRILLGAGADTTFSDSRGLTPLHVAAQGAHPDVICYLLAAGANVHAKNISGFTSLHLAARFDLRGRCISLLIAGGSNVNVRSDNGITPLHLAALFSNKVAIRHLREAGANKHIRDDLMGCTPKDLLKIH